MSISYSTYSQRTHQTSSESHSIAPAGRIIPDVQVSNVRPASSNLLASRMDALSLQTGRLACYGLE